VSSDTACQKTLWSAENLCQKTKVSSDMRCLLTYIVVSHRETMSEDRERKTERETTSGDTACQKTPIFLVYIYAFMYK